MGVIKTALEIALEKTGDIKADKSSIDQFELRQKGKKLANTFLSGDAGLKEELAKMPAEQRECLKQGVFDILITQITLPSGKEDQGRLEKAGQGLAEIIGKDEFTLMFGQLMQIMGKYLKDAAGYEKAIRQQFAPRLKQKEEELSRRTGREVRIDPLQDPEFAAFYSQHMGALRGNYEPVIEQAREEARKMFGKADE